MLYGLVFELSKEYKVMTRTRRKFWDDLSVRGGQYSAIMILLNALYAML